MPEGTKYLVFGKADLEQLDALKRSEPVSFQDVGLVSFSM